ncbi:hypothetical protein FRACYDRAFT_271786 [Fragilariopsis cylindrus CCMP1102]|uniref:Uncharacterized protein n=1 Tax=Fragilariopsis cylindrus CCMP1102 TaxID=635003 RepID=A0A1E7EQU4_9STRA|nr:hypothetical protein FRACYDRAFT_271786 [Fragilariopsis cylindrus CCMP1102]|eukprot:OEU08187.1 hypothetical protein FRACYDRAFT_271786 [Fragilariopsis cylindrus CCMP1102]
MMMMTSMTNTYTTAASNLIAASCESKNPLLLLHGDDVDVDVDAAVVDKVTTNKLFCNNSSSFSYVFPVSTVTNTVTQVDVVADTNNVSDDDDNDYVLEDDTDVDADDEDCSILLSMPMDVDVGVDVDDYDYDYDYVDIELYGNRSHNHSLPLLSSSSSSSSSLPFAITKSFTSTRPASIIKKKKNSNKNNKSRVISVRFDTKWINLSHDKSNITRRRRKIKKSNRSREQSAAVDSKLWYTRKEIKENHKSIIKAAKCNEKRKADLIPLPSSFSSSSYSCSLSRDNETQQEEKDIEVVEEDIHILNWFSSKQRKQRSNIRTQMNDIVKAVQEFENATQTHVPNLLSELLQRKSNSQQIKIRSQNNKSKLMILG